MDKFEQSFSAWLNCPYAFSFWKARVALYAILRGLNIGDGDEVILPGYTCVMDVNPIKYVGAKPVYADIEPNTFNMVPDFVEEKITLRTKLIIAQHTYGYPCDMERILQIAQKHAIPVIEDCCLALGSRYKGQLVGTFGRAAYFSFQWNKPFTTGLGGMAITNDSGLAQKIERLYAAEATEPSAKDVLMLAAQLAVYRAFIYPRTTALAQTLFRFLTRKGLVVGSSSSAEFVPSMPSGFFKGMSAVQARSGIKQLNKLEDNICHRRKMADLYDHLLSEKGWPIRCYDKSVMDPVLVRYPVRIKQKQQALETAAAAGIELGSWFESPLHPQETPLAAYDYTLGMCPEAEKAAAETVNLPLHPRAGEKTVRRTADFISQFTPA
ncbi:MAG TPA: DegT/DnrJ/EryC1/StrS family aminotransferase [Anaerohalosphaeraceae bacterium]|nr:DegT/DnrJ/EryC1/StrS family aminotransferase [Anaerohalosphaeraceae bacterium]HOM76694.1 DegT/DnrJ/EryC1/StrS family aminotransferase [Anaerohalosphaeraceae bacterium]HPC64121.1 DegT/DnrJ/EryC1/StrS family aminotransferase [Anaerohalosphaeraceae bacterium]HPO70289.1 DegT/DnrJ/EryC1/StrS family aminotransferase [Anaerohalosphaeraceae bacterium]HRS71501.1 DegT/DnrJ/EryC1/StrS family aminotransferase [Anaerohalosphaeraceae bacterium]